MKPKMIIKRFENILQNNERVFFDYEEFEVIIDYFSTSNQYRKASIAIEMALEQYPSSIDFLLHKVKILYDNKEIQNALDILSKAEIIDPIHPEVFMTKGAIYNQMGSSEKAIECFKSAIKNAGAMQNIIEDGYRYLAFEYEQLKQYDNAIFCLKKVIGFNPENNDIFYELSCCYEVSGKDNEAVEFFNSLLDNYPYSYCAWFNLGIVYDRLELFEKAIEAYDYVIAIKKDFAPGYFNKANAMVNLDRLEEAILLYYETFKYEKPEALTYCYIGECYEKLENYKQAMIHYNKAISIDPDLADAWLGMGIVLDHQDRTAEGIHYLKKAIRIENQNVEFWYTIANAYKKLGFSEETETAYQKVIELEPSIESIWLDYSDLLFELGDKEKVIEILAEGIKHHPNSVEIYYRMAACLLWTGKKQEALIYLQHALQHDFKKHKEIFKFIPGLRKNRELLDLIKTYQKQ
ncbi:MAG: tetratricopeptide repeat protein [Bacteroidota bacterium]